MRHLDMGHTTEIRKTEAKGRGATSEDFVLEKDIFNNVFEKDIRRVFIYKKAERLAKAVHLISPAFVESASLKNRLDQISISIIDAAISPFGSARDVLSRELLALSSMLSMARTGGFLSAMNSEIIAHEAHILLQEVAAYEEPRLLIDDASTLSSIAKKVQTQNDIKEARPAATRRVGVTARKGHIKDVPEGVVKDRRESILAVIKSKGTASIKDISTLIRTVSEKTIQRELIALIGEGRVLKQGERRWSTYSLQ